MTSYFTETPGPNMFGLPFQHEHAMSMLIVCPVRPVIFLFALTSNTMNILVFLKSGMKDNVTILLLRLSLSDFCFLLLLTLSLATILIMNFAPKWNWTFDINIVSYLFYWPAFTLYDFSAYVSVFLGVTRCACVAWPLHFKSVFTMSRTITTVVILFISTILLRMPVLMVHSIGVKINPLTNQSYAYLKRNEGPTNKLINDTLSRTSLPWVAFLIMVACVIILSVKLIGASKVRQPPRYMPGSITTSTTNKTNNQVQHNNSSSSYKMSAKESHVVQSVVLVCVIFILPQLPFLLCTTACLIYPEFDQRTKLLHLFGICTLVSLTCSFLNASVNIFIYYNYSSKYRSTLKSMFCFKMYKSIINTKCYSYRIQDLCFQPCKLTLLDQCTSSLPVKQLSYAPMHDRKHSFTF